MLEPQSHYLAFPMLVDALKMLDSSNRDVLVLANLEKIYHRVENLFLTERLEVPSEKGAIKNCEIVFRGFSAD